MISYRYADRILFDSTECRVSNTCKVGVDVGDCMHVLQ
jgi:hypothetical protein